MTKRSQTVNVIVKHLLHRGEKIKCSAGQPNNENFTSRRIRKRSQIRKEIYMHASSIVVYIKYLTGSTKIISLICRSHNAIN